ncbi:MAG: hypothetical protein PHT62_04105 [Desulfotomaculaceae bacterium]|nr:hypothetical protein [Desulfotomaculaceae bacterium]
MDKRKYSNFKIALVLIFVATIIACIGTQIASAGTLVKQYDFGFYSGGSNPQYSPTFTANSSVVSITGWQVSQNGTPSVGYAIARLNWTGSYTTLTSTQYVNDTYPSSSWFAPLNFTNIPDSSWLSLKASTTMMQTTCGANIYDGW